MLDSIREGVKKPWVKVVIFAIIISFVFAGGFSASSLLGDPNAVAVVNGESVSRNEFQRALANEKARRADFYQANVKTEDDEKNFQENVLQQLITSKVSAQSVQELGFRLSKPALKKVIQSEPNYQLDGKYSSSLVEQTLARIGMSREEFKRAYQNQETARQLNAGLFQTDFSLDGEVRKEYELMSQKRSGRALKIDFALFNQNLDISEEEISQYYSDNQESFRIEETVSVDYLELSVADLQAQQVPTEEEIQTYYDDNLARFKSDDQRQYSHILILSNGDEDAALEKANALSKRLDAGEDFAEIAKTESDDIPTRETGGDLGILLEGSLDEPSEEAVKLLVNAGEITQPVKLDFGYQILKLTNLIEGETQSLEQVKDELLPELSKQLAEEAFYAKSEVLKEKAYEFADSLSEAAEATGLEIRTSPAFGHGESTGLFANSDVKAAAFSSDVMDGQLNSETIEVGDNHLLVLRTNTHTPSVIQPLEELTDRIKNIITQEKAKQNAEELANTLLTSLETKEPIDELLTEKELSWVDLDKIERNNATLTYLANSEFFKMSKPAEGSTSYQLVEDFQGYTILMLNAVEAGDWAEAEDADKTQRKLYVSSYYSNAGYLSYVQNLRKNAEVKRNQNLLAQ